MKEKILVVEDDRSICDVYDAVLTANGFDVITADTAAKAKIYISSHCPDIILLDLGLPDADGLTVLDYVREWSHIPVVVVSARTQESDKVKVLEAGADDYITKPFGNDELIARIHTALRHTRFDTSSASVAHSGVFKTGGLLIDYNKYRAYVDGIDAGLTQNEFKIVALLGKYAGRVLTYDYLMTRLWGPSQSGDNKILRVNMANIRRKIEKNPAEPKYIFTETGVGYRMRESDEAE